MPTHALVRAIPDSFPLALSRDDGPRPDVVLAHAEHALYTAALRALGLTVVSLPADEQFPDCVFVEDAVVVVGDTALITRSAAPSRAGEREAVAEALADHLQVRRMGRGHLDGGDVLIMEHTLYVGRSSRTDDDGIAELRSTFPAMEVVPIDVPDALHLLSFCSTPDGRTVVLQDGFLPPDTFHHPVLVTPRDEGVGANVVGAHGKVIVRADAVGCQRVLAEAGFGVLPVASTQVGLVDGAFTCCSVLFTPSAR